MTCPLLPPLCPPELVQAMQSPGKRSSSLTAPTETSSLKRRRRTSGQFSNYFSEGEEVGLQLLCGDAQPDQADAPFVEAGIRGVAAGSSENPQPAEAAQVLALLVPRPLPALTGLPLHLLAHRGNRRVRTLILLFFVKLRPYTLLGNFRLTPKAPEHLGGSGGAHGGYSGACPYHRKSPSTQCMKWSPF